MRRVAVAALTIAAGVVTAFLVRDSARTGDGERTVRVEGPSVKRRIRIDLMDATTLIFRFTPAPGEDRIPNGTEVVFGDAAFCSGG